MSKENQINKKEFSLAVRIWQIERKEEHDHS